MCGGFKHLSASSGGRNAHTACGNKQRSGFSRIDVVKLLFRKPLALSDHIEILPGTHPVAAYGVGEDLHAGNLVLCRKLTASYRAESLGLKSVACQRCGTFTVNDMICRFAAAKIIIIHARQIIVNEAVGMQHFYCTSDRQGFFNVSAGDTAKLKNKRRAYALTAGGKAVMH